MTSIWTMPDEDQPPLYGTASLIEVTQTNGGIFDQAQAATAWLPAPFASAATPTESSNATSYRHGTASTARTLNASTSPWFSAMADLYAANSNESQAAPIHATRHAATTATSAPDASSQLTAHKLVLARRSQQALTPYNPDAWEQSLRSTGLWSKYSHLPHSMRFGFNLQIPAITVTQAPPNKDSITEFGEEFQKIVLKESSKGRYLGPFSRDTLEALIGPFQSSPFGIIPKPGRIGHYRNVQNYSFPHTPSLRFPNPSINSQIDANRFPSTWGTFSIICLIISRLPPGSQVATRDVAEAYRTVPLHPSQWPGAVVRLDQDTFSIDTATCFGVSPSAGGYGCVTDASADLFRHHGIAPLSKWVDDHVFFRILREHLPKYNQLRQAWHRDITLQPQHHDGGRLWFGGRMLEDQTLDEFDEDCSAQCLDLTSQSPRSDEDRLFTYNFDDIDRLSDYLGIPWEKSKDMPFAPSTIFIGLDWNLVNLTVSLPPKKKTKYLTAIQEWNSSSTHTLNDVQKLYGKLLHSSLVLPAGRAYLTGLETMLGIYGTNPFLPRHAPKSIQVDLQWWSSRLSLEFMGRPIPAPTPLTDLDAYSDASSTGIAIVIKGHWRAWRLIPGWQTLNGKRDIGWAEAIGFELLTRAISGHPSVNRHFKVYGDNKGVVEGWWNSRSKNNAINECFRRIHAFTEALGQPTSFHTTLIPSKLNLADGPSRGIYPPRHLLLPLTELPPGLDNLIIDSTLPHCPLELRMLRQNRHPEAIPKHITDTPTHPDTEEQSDGDSLDSLLHQFQSEWNN